MAHVETYIETYSEPSVAYRWHYADWLAFPSDGWTYEIIHGVLHMAPPPAINHQRASGKLYRRMADFAEQHHLGEVLEAPCGVILPGETVPVQPDIFFVSQPDIIKQQYVEGAPDWVVEILSPATATYDRREKLRAYETAGVSEYWLVDYRQRTVEVFRLLAGIYQTEGVYHLGEVVNSQAMAGFQIAVATIFQV